MQGRSLPTMDKFWWNSEKDSVAADLFAHVENIKDKNAHSMGQRKKHLRLYGNMNQQGTFSDTSAGNSERITLNVIQMAIDTAQARVAKSKPKGRFLTDEGNFQLQRRGKNLERFVDGVYYQNELYEEAQDAFLDAGIFGSGAVKFWIEIKNKKPYVRAKRCFLMDLIVDEAEAMYGNPRQLYEVKIVNKYSLAEQYPKLKKQIEEVGAPDAAWSNAPIEDGNIVIIEGWKLGRGKTKGRHIIAVQNQTIIDEEWKPDFFPIEFYHYNRKPIGFWGRGISEVLTGTQFEINKLLRTIQIAMHLGSIPKVWVEAGSGVVKSHLNNEIGGIITYRGDRPFSDVLMKIPPELSQQLWDLYNKAFEQVGLNTPAVSGTVPNRLESGKAIREHNDTENERFSIVSQGFESFHMRLVSKIVDFSDLAFEDSKEFSVLTMSDDGSKRLNWKDVNLEEDSYVLKRYPVSLLSSTPQGKLADVTMMMEAGLLDQQQSLKLLDYPDIKGVTSLMNAAVEDIEKTIEIIIEDGEYEAPDELQDLETGIPMMQSAYLKYKRQNIEPEKLELMTTWIEDALNIINPPPTPEEVEEQEAMEEEEAVIMEQEALKQQQEQAMLPEPTQG